MLFSRKTLGVEIDKNGMKMVLVGGTRKAPLLEGHSALTLPAGTLSLSYKEPNILNPALFVAKLRELWLPLLTKTSRAAVSLPDSVGRMMVLDLDTRFRTRDEGRDIIRWKLKKGFSLDIADVHLDYQVLQEKETGEISTLVSYIAKPVVRQYEDLFAEAGLEPTQIDFTTFNLCSLFAARLDLLENGAFVNYYQNVMSVLVFRDGVLDFCRSCEITDGSGEANRMFLELNSSLLLHKERNPGFALTEVLCHAFRDEFDMLRSVAFEATGLEPVLLDAERVIACNKGIGADRQILTSVAAAVGAAMRSL